MDACMAVKRGEAGAALPALRRAPGRHGRRGRGWRSPSRRSTAWPARTSLRTTPSRPPFWGDRIVKGIPLADYAAYLDERATFMGQWGLKPARGDGPVLRGAGRDRGQAAAADVAGADADRGPARGRRWSTATSRA